MNFPIIWLLCATVLIYCAIIVGWNLYLSMIFVRKTSTKRCKCNSSMMLLSNLALADIGYCLLAPYQLFVTLNSKDNGNCLHGSSISSGHELLFASIWTTRNICHFIRGFYMLTSAWMITILAVSRQKFIIQNRVARIPMLTLLVAIIWLLSIIFGLPMLLFNANNIIIANYPSDNWQLAALIYLILWIFIQLLIPLLVISITVARIMSYLKHSTTRLDHNRSTFDLTLKLSMKSDFNSQDGYYVSAEHSGTNGCTLSTPSLLALRRSTDYGGTFSSHGSDNIFLGTSSGDQIRSTTSSRHSSTSNLPICDYPSSGIRVKSRNNRVYRYLCKVVISFAAFWLIQVMLYCNSQLQLTIDLDIAAQLSLLLSPMLNIYLYHWLNRNIRREVRFCPTKSVIRVLSARNLPET